MMAVIPITSTVQEEIRPTSVLVIADKAHSAATTK